MENKKVEVRFVPGCFDNFHGSQEELDELMVEIKNFAELCSTDEENEVGSIIVVSLTNEQAYILADPVGEEMDLSSLNDLQQTLH